MPTVIPIVDVRSINKALVDKSRDNALAVIHGQRDSTPIERAEAWQIVKRWGVRGYVPRECQIGGYPCDSEPSEAP